MQSPVLGAIGVAAAGALATLLTVNRAEPLGVGRRPLLLASYAGMALSALGVGLLDYLPPQAWPKGAWAWRGRVTLAAGVQRGQG